MSHRSSDTSRTLRASRGLLLAVFFLMLGNGLLGTVLGVRSELEGFATATTGVVMASYYVGFLFSSQVAPKSVARVGHIRVFAALASSASIAALIHAVAVDPIVWSAMRFVTGFCMAGLYVVSESWLNGHATNANRGRLLALYMVVLMGGIGLGQLLLNVAAPSGFELFAVTSVLVSLSVVPIAMSEGAGPSLTIPDRIPLGELWRLAPLGIIGGLGAGLAAGAFIGLGAVWATRAGLDPPGVGLFMGTAVFGSVLMQWPIGALSDRIPRRRALGATALAGAIIAGLMAQLEPESALIFPLVLLLGGFLFPIYSIALSHINDVLAEGKAAAASAAFVLINGVGAIIGPLWAAGMMEWVGDAGFFVTLSVIHAAIAFFALYRIAVQSPVPTDDQTPYRLIPARSSAVVATLFRRRSGNGHRSGSKTEASAGSELD